jgi:hypothetical protein
MSPEERQALREATRIGKQVRFSFPADQKRRSIVGQVVDEVCLIRDRHKLVIEQIRYVQRHLWNDDEVAYRLGYFRVRKSWGVVEITWSTRAMLITESELDFLLRQARQKGWRVRPYFASSPAVPPSA